LKNIFSCWSGLIDVYLLPNKNCGYVKYAEVESAQLAIRTLNGAEICGTKIKVCTVYSCSVADKQAILINFKFLSYFRSWRLRSEVAPTAMMAVASD